MLLTIILSIISVVVISISLFKIYEWRREMEICIKAGGEEITYD